MQTPANASLWAARVVGQTVAGMLPSRDRDMVNINGHALHAQAPAWRSEACIVACLKCVSLFETASARGYNKQYAPC